MQSQILLWGKLRLKCTEMFENCNIINYKKYRNICFKIKVY